MRQHAGIHGTAPFIDRLTGNLRDITVGQRARNRQPFCRAVLQKMHEGGGRRGAGTPERAGGEIGFLVKLRVEHGAGFAALHHAMQDKMLIAAAKCLGFQRVADLGIGGQIIRLIEERRWRELGFFDIEQIVANKIAFPQAARPGVFFLHPGIIEHWFEGGGNSFAVIEKLKKIFWRARILEGGGYQTQRRDEPMRQSRFREADAQIMRIAIGKLPFQQVFIGEVGVGALVKRAVEKPGGAVILGGALRTIMGKAAGPSTLSNRLRDAGIAGKVIGFVEETIGRKPGAAATGKIMRQIRIRTVNRERLTGLHSLSQVIIRVEK